MKKLNANTWLVLLSLIVIGLDYLSQTINLGAQFVDVLSYYLILFPVLIVGLNRKKIKDVLQELKEYLLKWSFRTLSTLLFLYAIYRLFFVAYVKIKDFRLYLTSDETALLAHGHLSQTLYFAVLSFCYILWKEQFYQKFLQFSKLIIGDYKFPKWIGLVFKLLNKGIVWIKEHKKQTAIALGTYGVLVLFFAAFIKIEMPKTQVITDAVQDSKLGKKHEKKTIDVSFYNPSMPRFKVVDDKVVTEINNLGISFQENPFDLDKKLEMENTFVVEPTIKGKWKKVSDSFYEFVPSEHWLAGVDYKISLELDSYLKPNIEMTKTGHSFAMDRFQGNIQELKFYINPKDPSEKSVVGHVHFNYPINKKSIKKKVSFIVKNKKGKILDKLKGKVFMDKTETIAYIHSEGVKLRRKKQYIELQIDEGVESKLKFKPSDKNISRSLKIPSMYSFMTIDLRAIDLEKDMNDLPYHSFHILSNTALEQEALKEKLEIYRLPYYINEDLKEYLTNQRSLRSVGCLNYEYDQKTKNKKYYANWHKCIQEMDSVLNKLVSKVDFEFVESKFIDPSKHEVKFDAKAKDYYLVVLKEGFASEQGYVLEDSLHRISRAPSFPKEIKLATDGSILSLGGNRKLSVYSRGVKKLKLNIKQVLANQIQHILSQSNGDKKNINFRNYRFDESNITREFKKEIELDFDLKRGGYTTVDFSPYLNSKGLNGKNYGIFFVEFLDENNKQYNSQLIILSDIAYVVKQDTKYNRDFYIMSSSSGKPLPDVKVKVLFKNGLSKNVCTTSLSGFCRVPNDSKEGVGFLLQKGSDYIFSKFSDRNNLVNYSRFDVSGEYQYGESVKAYLFSDRKLYRPGEGGHLGIIIKDQKWTDKYVGELVHLEIKDPRGKPFKAIDLVVGKYGFITFPFDIPYASSTGDYTINLYRYTKMKRKSSIGYASIKVQEFLPDKMKIAAKFNKPWSKAWIHPDDLKGLVTLRNLFGIPASGNEVEGTLILSPSQVRFPTFKDFVFYDEKVLSKSHTLDLGKLKTDKSGNARFDLDLKQYRSNTFRLRFHAEAFLKSGGRSVVGENRIMVSPYDYLIGIKKPSNLNFVTKKTKSYVKVIAVNNEYDAIDVTGLKLVLFEKKYQNTLVKQADGTYAYQDTKEPKRIRELPFNISKDGTNYLVENSSVGEFIAEIQNKDNEVLNRFEYTVVGEADLARSLYRNAELQIKLNKSDYKVGDTIKISLKAPYKGSGLITIEREKVFAHKWIELKKPTSVVSIKVPKGIEGNAYINIALLRSNKSKKVFTSPFSYGVVPFTIDKSRRVADIEIDAPYEVKPGEEINIKYRSKQKGHIVLYGIDEGILQLAKYKTPAPLNYFFKKRALQVSTYQLFSLVLPEIEMVKQAFATGGGMGDAVKGKNLNPFKRKFTKAVAFWSDIIPVSFEWKEYKYKIPSHFNGSLKTFAVFVSKDSIGIDKRKIVSRDDVIITPTIPTFLAPGDKAKLSTSISNNYEGEGSDEFTVEFNVSKGLKLKSKKKQKIKVERYGDKLVNFAVEATDHPGNAKIEIIVHHKKGKTIFEENLSVRPHTPFIRRNWRQLLSAGDAVINFDLRSYYSQFFDFDVDLTPGFWALIQGSIRSLSRYPYGCSEQLTSKAVPYIYFSAEQINITRNEVHRYLERTFDLLLSRQRSDGRIDLYHGGNSPDFLNLYIAQFLIKAKKKEFKVPGILYDRLMRYIETMAKSDSLVAASHAVYLLAQTERQVSVMAKMIAKENSSNDLVNLYLAASFKILEDDKNAAKHFDKVNDKFKNFAKNLDLNYDYYSYSSLSRTYIEIVTTYFPEKAGTKVDKMVEKIIKQLERYGTNSLWSAKTIMALSNVADEGRVQDVPITVKYHKGKDKVIRSQELSSLKKEAKKIKGIRFEIPKNKRFFYSMNASGFNTKIKPFSKKLQVAKRYLDDDGNEINSVKIGDEVIVEINIQPDYELDNGVIVDLVPGGFDLVWTNWERGDNFGDSKTSDFIEKREDRILFYTSLNGQEKYYYKIKAVAKGKFITPGVYVEDMYKTKNQALGKTGKIEVID